MKRRRKTAKEIMDRLQSDPEWVRENAGRAAKEKARIAQRLKDIEPEHVPLLGELAAAGVRVRPNIITQWESGGTVGPDPGPVRSISDLVNTRDSYPPAIPVLVKHLRTVRHPIMVTSIARALTVKEARNTEAARVILDRLKQTQPSATDYGDDFQARFALANALTVVADKSMRDEIKTLVEDARYQDVRDRLEVALKKRCGG